MQLIDATNAEEYLRETGRLTPGDRVKVRELAGGVSNIVLLVEFEDPELTPFILKQAREQLRVAQPWFCSPRRIWREAEVLQYCRQALEGAKFQEWQLVVPQVLFEDREQFLFAMTAAAPDALTWKAELMRQCWSSDLASACGALLGCLHRASWQSAPAQERFQDRQYFHDLRVDPYYGAIACRHPSLAPQIEELIAGMDAHRTSLVHGDFSPKNLLVSAQEIMLIDCEVGHFGDPAFDLGFVCTHLQLKAMHFPQWARCYAQLANFLWREYQRHVTRTSAARRALEQRVISHLRACLLARVDGKSPVEYLSPYHQELVRSLALRWFESPPDSLQQACSQVVAWSRGKGDLIE